MVIKLFDKLMEIGQKYYQNTCNIEARLIYPAQLV